MTEEIFETIMTRNFPNLTSDTKSQIQEAQRIPWRIKKPYISAFQKTFDKDSLQKNLTANVILNEKSDAFPLRSDIRHICLLSPLLFNIPFKAVVNAERKEEERKRKKERKKEGRREGGREEGREKLRRKN